MSKIIPKRPQSEEKPKEAFRAVVFNHNLRESASGVSLLYERRALFSEKLSVYWVDFCFLISLWIAIVEPLSYLVDLKPPFKVVVHSFLFLGILAAQIYQIMKKGRSFGGWLYGVHRIAEDGLPVLNFSKLTGHENQLSFWGRVLFRKAESADFKINKGHPEFEHRPRMRTMTPLALGLLVFSFGLERMLSQYSQAEHWIEVLESRGVILAGVKGSVLKGLEIEKLSLRTPSWQFEATDLKIEFDSAGGTAMLRSLLESRMDLKSLHIGGLRFFGTDPWTIANELFTANQVFWVAKYLNVIKVEELSVKQLQFDSGSKLFYAEDASLKNLGLDFNEKSFSLSEVQILSREFDLKSSLTYLRLDPLELKSREFSFRIGKGIIGEHLHKDLDLQGTVNLAFSADKGLAKKPIILIRGFDQKLEIESKGEDLVMTGRKLNLSDYFQQMPPAEMVDAKIKFKLESRITFESLIRVLDPSGEVRLGNKIYDLRRASEVWGKRINEDHAFWPVARSAWFFLIPRGEDRDSIGVTPLSEVQSDSKFKTWLHYFEGRGSDISGLLGPEDLIARVFFEKSFFALSFSERQAALQLKSHFHWKAWTPRWDKPSQEVALPTAKTSFQEDLSWGQVQHFQIRSPAAMRKNEESSGSQLVNSYSFALKRIAVGDCGTGQDSWTKRLEAQVQGVWRKEKEFAGKSIEALAYCSKNILEKKRYETLISRLKKHL